MSKSIYEEAIGQLLKIQGRLSTNYDKFLEVKQALEQAQKQEKLLELYRKLTKLYEELYTAVRYTVKDLENDK